ncbi:MAG: glycosyltransferase [Bacteroidaceae bacterium]|nr:glycosyltransferase [Bacteroidaceae bacterium]
MNVLFISTCERSGGGAIAARRIMDALTRNGVEAKMMVRDRKLPKLLERLAILPRCGFRRSRLWQADIANVGINITGTEAFKKADVIHLHWVNQGMVSLDEMGKILSCGKRIVWTLHDEWPYLGVCHYRGECQEKECRKCPILCGDLPYKIYRRKHEMYRRWHPIFVGCSQWITEQARLAMPGERVEHINNCIPSALFHPIDMQQARKDLALPQDKRLLLFCSQKVTDERKGIAFLTEALQLLPKDDLHLLIVGRHSEQIPLPDGIRATCFGSVDEQTMPKIYNAADAFLTPSLQDNLPNTIAEAMSCGTPCVGFNVGGIPEMIDHMRNGYVARYRDASDLAEGIRFVLSHDLRDAALAKATKAFDETHVALEYIKIYRE